MDMNKEHGEVQKRSLAGNDYFSLDWYPHMTSYQSDWNVDLGLTDVCQMVCQMVCEATALANCLEGRNTEYLIVCEA